MITAIGRRALRAARWTLFEHNRLKFCVNRICGKIDRGKIFFQRPFISLDLEVLLDGVGRSAQGQEVAVGATGGDCGRKA